MEQTMKKLLGLIIGLVVIAAVMAGLGAGAYSWSGSLAKESFEKSMKQTTGEQIISYKVKNYTEGLLISTIEAEISIDTQKLNDVAKTQIIPIDQPIIIPLEHKIYHGPFVFKAPDFDPTAPVAAFIETKVKPTPEIQGILTMVWQGAEPLKIRSKVSFSGLVETTMEIAPINFVNPDGSQESLKWTGAKSIVAHDTTTNSFDSSIHAGGISVDSKNVWFLIDGIKGKAKGSFADGSFINANASYTIDNVKFDINQMGMEIKGSVDKFSLGAGNKIEGKNFSSFIKLSVADVDYNGDKYGPAKFQLDLRKIDAEAVKTIAKELEVAKQEMAKQGLPPEAAIFIAQQKLMEGLPKLLQHGPEIEISALSLNTPQGKINGHTKIALDLEGKPMPQNPLELIPLISIDANISIPTSLVEMALTMDTKKSIRRDLALSGEKATEDEIIELINNDVKAKIESLTAQNIIKVEASNIVGAVKLNKGMLNLNGLEIPVEQLIGSMVQGQQLQ